MEDIVTRFWENLVGRIDGPMKFRIIIQPLMSLIYAFIAGRRDAKGEKVPYFVGLITSTGQRRELVKEGWKDVGKIFIIAVVIDVIYQLVMIFGKETQSAFYPVETIVTAIILSFIPYLIFRGPVNRIFRSFKKDNQN